jgi:hypothetical protein
VAQLDLFGAPDANRVVPRHQAGPVMQTIMSRRTLLLRGFWSPRSAPLAPRALEVGT